MRFWKDLGGICPWGWCGRSGVMGARSADVIVGLRYGCLAMRLRRDCGQDRGGSRGGVELRMVCLEESTFVSLAAEVGQRLEPGVRWAMSRTDLGSPETARTRR